MKKTIILVSFALLMCCMVSCSSTKTTIYDKSGKIEKIIESDSNAVFEGVLNLREKIVIVFKDNLEISIIVTMDAENPVPHGKIIFNNGVICVATIPKDIDPEVLKALAELVKNIKGKVEVSFDGINKDK